MKMKKENKGARGKTHDRESLKRELTGIVFMLVSFLLICFLLSFHPEDDAGFTAIAWRDIFSKAARDAAESIHNPFGPLGVKLSSFFIRTYGYPVILPLTAIFFWGWSLFRANSLKPALLFFLYSVTVSVDHASMFGLTSAPFSDIMAGSIGRMLAEKLKVIGDAGAWVLLSVLAVVLTIYMGRALFPDFQKRLVAIADLVMKPVSLLKRWLETIGKKKR